MYRVLPNCLKNVNDNSANSQIFLFTQNHWGKLLSNSILLIWKWLVRYVLCIKFLLSPSPFPPPNLTDSIFKIYISIFSQIALYSLNIQTIYFFIIWGHFDVTMAFYTDLSIQHLVTFSTEIPIFINYLSSQ